MLPGSPIGERHNRSPSVSQAYLVKTVELRSKESGTGSGVMNGSSFDGAGSYSSLAGYVHRQEEPLVSPKERILVLTRPLMMVLPRGGTYGQGQLRSKNRSSSPLQKDFIEFKKPSIAERKE